MKLKKKFLELLLIRNYSCYRVYIMLSNFTKFSDKKLDCLIIYAIIKL